MIAVGTLGSVSSEKYSMNQRHYSFCLFEEAAQSPEFESCCGLARLRFNASICLAGDYRQLPLCSRNENVKEYTQLSMMERLSKAPGVKHVLLTTQYRMVDDIARWPSRYFYESRLQTASTLCQRYDTPEGFCWP